MEREPYIRNTIEAAKQLGRDLLHIVFQKEVPDRESDHWRQIVEDSRPEVERMESLIKE